jgi:hypothetical protein
MAHLILDNHYQLHNCTLVFAGCTSTVNIRRFLLWVHLFHQLVYCSLVCYNGDVFVCCQLHCFGDDGCECWYVRIRINRKYGMSTG